MVTDLDLPTPLEDKLDAAIDASQDSLFGLSVQLPASSVVAIEELRKRYHLRTIAETIQKMIKVCRRTDKLPRKERTDKENITHSATLRVQMIQLWKAIWDQRPPHAEAYVYLPPWKVTNVYNIDPRGKYPIPSSRPYTYAAAYIPWGPTDTKVTYWRTKYDKVWKIRAKILFEAAQLNGMTCTFTDEDLAILDSVEVEQLSLEEISGFLPPVPLAQVKSFAGLYRPD